MDYKQLIESLNNIETIAFGYSVNGKVCGMDCSDFEQIIVDAVEAITDLLAHTKTAEARAEKAEREKNYAIELLRGVCYACRNYSAHCHKGKCNNCKWDRTYDYEPNGNEDNWEWCGLKEE